MSKNEIIEWLYKDKNFNISLNKICPDVRYKDDLRSEFFIILTEKDEATIQNMFNKNYLVKWAASVLQNQYHSKTSPFYKKYRSMNKVEYNLELIPDWKEELFNIDILSEVEFILDNEIHWFDAHLFKLYYLQTINKDTGELRKPLSTRKIEELHRFNHLKIDHTSVHKSVKKTLSVVIEKLNKKGLLDKWKQ